jgi:ferredoxin
MKVKVDADACTGCELCVDTCPDVFEMKDGVATAKMEDVPSEVEALAREAADNCPAEAIQVEE